MGHADQRDIWREFKYFIYITSNNNRQFLKIDTQILLLDLIKVKWIDTNFIYFREEHFIDFYKRYK